MRSLPESPTSSRHIGYQRQIPTSHAQVGQTFFLSCFPAPRSLFVSLLEKSSLSSLLRGKGPVALSRLDRTEVTLVPVRARLCQLSLGLQRSRLVTCL